MYLTSVCYIVTCDSQSNGPINLFAVDTQITFDIALIGRCHTLNGDTAMTFLQTFAVVCESGTLVIGLR